MSGSGKGLTRILFLFLSFASVSPLAAQVNEARARIDGMT